MPVYLYNCKIHGEFEEQQSIKDPPLEACPKCVSAGIVEYYCPTCDLTTGYSTEAKDIFDVIPNPAHTKCGVCDIQSETRFPKPKKLISLSSFQLRGGGWASEGYK